ncbi:type IVB secretion system protein DotA [Fluoribacter dumoffii]|uniref:Phagosome trafficking protein DotA n=1 Tax=Fluoribacter dumoffii TaxID=463 RepID=A0A377G691_9GAMM|nr:type IVB secretion system protein DotA [Fluoribacter dumoffii]KTC92515.1 defect in organelle trafficking protein DotA [Fluoribacter dumoffii NY 23]MCW8387091.1 type IVB secretion system protein DotA [Fluoribacter dumoffii]MCW8417405.1 type IVB secretion system protein DotA [Fluoribacter dumoffii]MCW8454754.1 type IVB secretion system protein DotA [Fluoribacter dumoffii]MCW8461169.1 type IVB secretion system protein DotA [Fluoribacter dumoffii]
MKRLLGTLLLLLFPGLVLADSSLSFAPPASDYSVVFLGNLFGVVDGVLSGTGSQIMGSMFAVFNAAVLALGGIIIMYTLMVATMNTAHEGQMLGQKWSSIWIPIRSTVGLALLIPKTSGYCLMQVFVMWVVVQGVGAADKVWDAALSYLNRGGVIIQAQQINPASELTNNSSGSGVGGVATGAINILAGQVCMLGLQTQLTNQRQALLDAQAKQTGACYSATEGSSMQQFCNTVVPDFLSSVNAIAIQDASPYDSSWKAPMPNLPSSSPYSFLNGICGTITWKSISSLNSNFGTLPAKPTSGNNVKVGNNTLTPSEILATQLSRAVAIQQMYTDLSTVARSMISNDPQMSTATTNNSTSTPYSAVANEQFGVPYKQNGTVCQSYNSGTAEKDRCIIWGPVQGTAIGGTLFNGTELINAINSYNGIMMPTVNLSRLINSASNDNKSTEFINKAMTQGWIMAGAYFFNLVQIQGTSSITNAGQTDSNTGLDGSTFDPTALTSPFVVGNDNKIVCGPGNMTDQGKDFTKLCTWFNQDNTAVNQIQALITTTSPPKKPAWSSSMTLVDSAPSSTVYGFLNNALMMQTPGQPGVKPLTFANSINFSVNTSLYRLERQNFSCGEVKPFFSICLGQILGNIFYNIILVTIYNLFLDIFGQIINSVVMAFLMIPLQGMATIFQQGLQIIAQPGVNPVVALANMGNEYINFAGNLWMLLLNMAVSSALIPVFGIFIFAMMSLAMPLVIAWVGVMVSVGFTTAYYIPILPYMIFTFGALGWLISVIEAMVAAPIVALGVTHPEGHDAFGKGEAAIMILVNVFLRPSMMIIGYISAIALSYVGVWVLNAGYDQAIAFIQQENTNSATLLGGVWAAGGTDSPSGTGGYTDWAGIYAFFFSILTYTTLYLVIIQKAFTLISYLPDKVLRWIGGTPESLGQETAQWGEEVKGKVGEGAKETTTAQGQIDKTLGGYGVKGVGMAKGMIGKAGGGGDVSAQGNSTPSQPEGNDNKSGSPKTSGGQDLGGADNVSPITK